MKKLVVIFCLLFLSACTVSTKLIEVPVEVVKTEYVKQIIYDSVYLHDSVDRFVKGDTVFMYKYKYKYVYKTINDTLKIVDSVPIVLKETTTVEVNKLRWWQKTLMYTGLFFIGFIIVKLILKLR